MVTIQLYQPKLYNKEIQFAENWNELLPAELEAIAQHFLITDGDINTVKASLFTALLKIRSGDAELPNRLDAEDCAINGLDLISYLFTSNGLTKQPYPALQIGGNLFTGPADHFDTIQTGEYEEAFIHYLNFKESNDAAHLLQLAATLYRPAPLKFITYQAASADNIVYAYEANVPIFKALSAVQLYTIFMWFDGCQALLQAIFANVYNGSASDDAADLLVFTKCIHAAAGDKNGTRDAIRRMLLKELLFDMEQEAIKQKELEEFYKNQK